MIRGPCCSTGAQTPSDAARQVVAPQPKRRDMISCSVTPHPRQVRTPAAAPRPRAQRWPGRHRAVVRPGFVTQRLIRIDTIDRFDAGCSGCPPGLAWGGSCGNDFGAGLAKGESDDGGLDECGPCCPTAAAARRRPPATPRSPTAARRSRRRRNEFPLTPDTIATSEWYCSNSTPSGAVTSSR